MLPITLPFTIEIETPPSLNTLYIKSDGGVSKTAFYKFWLDANPIPESYKLDIDYPVRIEMSIHNAKKNRDIDNYWKASLDLLVQQGVLHDDNSTIVVELLIVNFVTDQENTGFVEITITHPQIT